MPIAASVHVQVGAAKGQEIRETSWLETQARESGIPNAIVGFCDLTDPKFERILDDHQSASPRFRGVRQIVSRHPLEDTTSEGETLLKQAGFRRGLAALSQRGLSFDLQLSSPLLKAAAETFDAIPDLPVALCHAGSPWQQDPEGLERWRDGLLAFARLPHASCKISGLGMFDPNWTAESLKPIVETVIEVFGPERVMWGSNFPVDKLYHDYRSMFETVWNIVPQTHREAMFGGNATRLYRLALPD